MWKNIKKVLLSPFIVGVFLVLLASPILGAEYNVKFGTPDPATGSTSMGAQWFLNELKKRTNGRIESILMSLPPAVQWHYDHHPAAGSPEEALLKVLKSPVEWV